MKTILYLLLLLRISLMAQSTIDSTGSSFAYSSNAGWFNLRPSAADGVVVTGYWLSGNAWAANVGWINFGGGTPTNGYAYANNSASDFGVNHDGAGNLSGYAYGANIGWINFGWTNSGDLLRPRIDLLTGDFSGYAYAANIGWINLGSAYLRTGTIAFPDSDGDGIADAWEMQNFGNLTTANATSDADHDGVTDKDEFVAGTRPTNPFDSFKILSHSYDPSFTQATLGFGFTSTTRLYRIDYSDDLSRWYPSSLGVFAPDMTGVTSRTISFPAGPRRFFRVVALLPLQP
jgi:hypothetical protein